ncbi:metal-dependent hydrolase [Haloferax profundi]|uniref:Metal-dependent hydrolase n=1 Tax=Haloferax profundi TaxID=1544718 RepID=A0A0W1SKB9_9EURY|nr:metal-dependent hydrolase [Haloferax profundi]KTG26714.1 metal-dependent hydrolase [Haloferax profundi]
MWPWEHVAVGYILVSLWARVAKRPLDGRAVLAVLVGTQFPDLVDKPLAWSLDVLPSGISLGHSIFVSIPLSILVVLVARRFEVTTVGVAFALGYLSHIPADLFYSGFFFGNYGALESFLWPISHGPDSSAAGLFTQTWYYLSRFLVYIRRPEAWAYLLFEVLLLGSAFLAWVTDGRPGLSLVKRSVNGIRRSVTR